MALGCKDVAKKKDVAEQHIADCRKWQEIHEKKANGYKEGINCIQDWVKRMEEEETRDAEFKQMMTELDTTEDLELMEPRQEFYVQAADKILGKYSVEDVIASKVFYTNPICMAILTNISLVNSMFL